MPKYEQLRLHPLLKSDVKPAEEFANRSVWKGSDSEWKAAGKDQEVKTTQVTMTTFNQQQALTQRQ